MSNSLDIDKMCRTCCKPAASNATSLNVFSASLIEAASTKISNVII